MVGRDIQQDGDIGTEVVHIVQLEGAELNDIVGMRVLCHLQCQGVTDIACQADVISRILEDVIDE